MTTARSSGATVATRCATMGTMRSGTFDRDTAVESTRRLAAMTDQEVADGIRSAAAAVLTLVAARPAGLADLDARAAVEVEQTRRALTVLPADATVSELVIAVAPVLNVWWPDSPAAVRPVHAAVEALRAAAMHTPRLVDDARRITSPG